MDGLQLHDEYQQHATALAVSRAPGSTNTNTPVKILAKKTIQKRAQFIFQLEVWDWFASTIKSC